MIETDIIIIGAGPAGLFTVFEAGLLKLRCHVIDALPTIGGQLSEASPGDPALRRHAWKWNIPRRVFEDDLTKEHCKRLTQNKISAVMFRRKVPIII